MDDEEAKGIIILEHVRNMIKNLYSQPIIILYFFCHQQFANPLKAQKSVMEGDITKVPLANFASYSCLPLHIMRLNAN